MARLNLLNVGGVFQYRCLGICALMAAGPWGCSSLSQRQDAALTGAAGVNRRIQLREAADPAAKQVATTQPAQDSPPGLGPRRLNRHGIVRMVYERSPLVTVGREEMVAARHGLEEFKTNLSRFEPFAKVDADASRFPERRDSKGMTGEIVGGLQKEDFEGAVVSVESGVSGSRVRFGEVEEDQDEVDQGSGALVRARLEVPFVGSRKRQGRVISQAFQESTARKAVLDYLQNYRSYVINALNYHQYALLYLNYARAYARQLTALEELLQAPGVRPEDRARIQSVAGDTKIGRDEYEAGYRSYLLYLLESVGIPAEEPCVLDGEPETPSPYLEQSSTPEGLRNMLDNAYLNNPRFRVLRRAIEDAELQRSQAILGEYDITAFVEGTQFPFGAETFDDRVGGWQVGAGLSVRANDRRVLTASRRKAEAEIRGYRAQIEAEVLSVQQQIATQTNSLRSYYESRPQIVENTAKDTAEFEQRRKKYLARSSLSLTIDDVLATLSSVSNAEVQLAANRYYAAVAENALMAATGDVYRLVGLSVRESGEDVEDNGGEVELSAAE